MRKKILFLIMVSLFAIVTVVWANNDSWSVFEKKDGIIQSQNGVLTKIPGAKEKNEVINSIDPITGMPMKKLDSAVTIGDEKYEEVVISHVFEGNKVELVFDVAYVDDVPVLLTNNDRPYVAISIPNSKESLIEYRENLFIVNVNDKSIRNAIAHQVAGYNYGKVLEYFDKKGEETQGLTWGGNASFSVDGSKMVYFSNRNISKNEQFKGEMWLKDWKSGEEKPLREWRSNILGWSPDDVLILESIGDSNMVIESFDINTGETKEIIGEFMTAGFSYPYIIYQQEPKLIHIHHIVTNETQLIQSELPNLARRFVVTEDSPWALVINAPDRTKLDNNILVINMETGEIKQLDPPENTIIGYTQWIDSTQFLVNAKKKGELTIETYFVELDKFWGGK